MFICVDTDVLGHNWSVFRAKIKSICLFCRSCDLFFCTGCLFVHIPVCVCGSLADIFYIHLDFFFYYLQQKGLSKGVTEVHFFGLFAKRIQAKTRALIWFCLDDGQIFVTQDTFWDYHVSYRIDDADSSSKKMRHILRPVIYECTVSTSQNRNLCVERQSFPDCCVLTNSNRNVPLQLK